MPMYFRNPKKYRIQVPLPHHGGQVNLNPGDVVEGEYFGRFSWLEPLLEAPRPGVRIAFSQTEREPKYQENLQKLAAVRTKPALAPAVEAPEPDEPEIPTDLEPDEPVEEERDETPAEAAAADEAEDEAAEAKQEVADAVHEAAGKKSKRGKHKK